MDTKIWVPDVIVLGPGGAKGYLILGFMESLEEDNYYVKTNEWIGCSIGASICLMISANYKVKEIINDCIDINVINDITDINLEHISDKPGLLTIKTIEDLLKQRMIERFGMVPTLKQLYMSTGNILKIVTFNRTKMRSEVLSKDTEPNLSVVEAVMMSMAIPGLVAPRIYKNNIYVDGALGDPYPILISDDGIKKILGVYIDSEQEINQTQTNHSSYMDVIKIWIMHMYGCLQASMKVLRDNSLKSASSNCKHISLNTPVIDTTGISLTREGKLNMIKAGYEEGVKFLRELKDPAKYKILLDEDEEIPNISEIEI
jgi:predicted acylesterase/phospholipase RssA